MYGFFRSSCTLLQQLGITEQQVKNNVEETLRELNLISGTGSSSLSAAIAREVVLKINSTFVERKMSLSCGSNVSAISLTESVDQLIQDVSLKMARNKLVMKPTTAHTSTSQKAIHVSLAAAIGGTVTAVFNRMETCLDDKSKSAKRWLTTMKEVLVCQSGAMKISPLNADLTSAQSVKAVSMEEFQIRAKKAISEVLVRKLGGMDFSSSSNTNFPSSDITTSNDGAVEKINQLPHCYHQPIEETSASVIETFVVNMKTIAQSSKDGSSAGKETELKTSADTPLAVYGGRVGQVQLATAKIYIDLKMILKDFFGNLQLSGAQARCKSDTVLPLTPAMSSLDLRPAHSDTDAILSLHQLDSCTKNVLKGVLSAYQPAKGQYLPLPSTDSSLEDSILFQLSEMASSSALFLTEDDLSKYSSSLTENDVSEKQTESQSIQCLRRLSSVEFQMNAFEAVTDILAASVHSHVSLQSSTISSEMDALPEIPWAEFSCKDLDSVVTGIVDQFVTDVKMYAEPLKSANAKDADLSGKTNSPYFPTASVVYENLYGKLKKIFTQCSVMRRGLGKKLHFKSASHASPTEISKEENNKEKGENLEETADLQSITTEVMMELVMALTEETSKNSKSSLENKLPSTSVPETHGFRLPSQHEIACIASTFVENVKTNDSDDIVRPLSEAIKKLSRTDIKTCVTKDVSKVILQAAEKVVGKSCPLAAEPTASEVAAEVIEGLKTLVSNLPSTTDNAKDLNVIRRVSLKMMGGLQRKLLTFFTKCQEAGTEVKGNAKKVISATLVCIKKGLSGSKNSQKSEDIKVIYDILNSMLKDIGEVDVQNDEDLTAVMEIAASSSSHSSSRWSECSDRFLPVSVCELTADGSIVKHTYIDMDDQVRHGLPAGISREIIVKVVKTVNEKIDLEDQLSMSSSKQGSLHSIALKLDKSLSSSSLSDDLTGRVYGLFKKSSRQAVHKSASDTALLNSGNGEFTKKRIASQFVKSYAEETVKHFLLPCFNLPSPYVDKPNCLVPASASASSQILIDLLNLLTEAMVKDVMSSFAQSDMYQEDHTQQTKEKRTPKRGILRFLPRMPKVKIFRKVKTD